MVFEWCFASEVSVSRRLWKANFHSSHRRPCGCLFGSSTKGYLCTRTYGGCTNIFSSNPYSARGIASRSG